MTDIQVTSARDRYGWMCRVTLTDADGSQTNHEVAVSPGDLSRFAPGATDPTDLVHRSFVFLLAREPKTSILRGFDLPVIGRFFPEFEARIRG